MKKTIDVNEFIKTFRESKEKTIIANYFSNEALTIMFDYMEKAYHKDYLLDILQIERNFEEKNFKELRDEFEYDEDNSDGEIESFISEQTEFIGMTGRLSKTGMRKIQTYVFRSL